MSTFIKFNQNNELEFNDYILEMGKKYKVHRGYDPNELFDESCKCISSQTQVSQFKSLRTIKYILITFFIDNYFNF